MTRRIPDPARFAHFDRDGFTIVVFDYDEHGNERIIAQHEFLARAITQLDWSPDSRFLLFTTTDQGGHSPWHFNTFVFSASDKTFRDVESAVGSVTSEEFHFEPPDVAVLRVQDADRTVSDDGEREAKVSLSGALQRMRVLK